jgi:hypothetical protein
MECSAVKLFVTFKGPVREPPFKPALISTELLNDFKARAALFKARAGRSEF